MSATFKELGRTKANDTTDLVLSAVIDKGELKGWNFNTYIRTERYTGFTKGVFVPEESIEMFGEMVKTAMNS